MARKKAPPRILWALDPFEKEGETRAHVVSALQKLTEKRKAIIEPTYVLSPAEFDLALEFSPPWLKEYKPTTEKILTQALKDIILPGLISPHVLVEKKPSLRQSIRSLLSYGKRVNADMIAVGTHARNGLSRVLLGSFAETLLLHSRIPLFITGAHSSEQGIEHILFATDFGKSANVLFSKVLELAQELGARITLLHIIPRPLEPVLQTGVYLLSGGWISLPDFLTQEEKKKQKIAERYAEIAKKQGIPLKVVIDSSHNSVSHLILQNAKEKNANLIAMAAESGPIASAVLGSVSRQVVRTAPCPVWIMRA